MPVTIHVPLRYWPLVILGVVLTMCLERLSELLPLALFEGTDFGLYLLAFVAVFVLLCIVRWLILICTVFPSVRDHLERNGPPSGSGSGHGADPGPDPDRDPGSGASRGRRRDRGFGGRTATERRRRSGRTRARQTGILDKVAAAFINSARGFVDYKILDGAASMIHVTDYSSQFVSSRGNEYFCEIDEDYLTDRFNLTGLNAEVPYYQHALDLVTDVFDLDADDELREQIEKSARHLYGLVHARYIVTTRGLAKMVSIPSG